MEDTIHTAAEGVTTEDANGEVTAASLNEALKHEVIAAISEIFDPEIPVNIYDLGLVYDVTVSEKGEVDIRMTVTAPACPVAGELPQWAADAVDLIEGTGEIEVHLVWDPPWDQSMMTEEAKMALGMF